MTAVRGSEGRVAVAPAPLREVEALARLAERASAAVSVLDLFRGSYDAVAAVVPAPVFLLALYDEASRMIEVVRQVDRGKELAGGSFPLGSGFTSRAIRERRPVLIREWSKEAPIKVIYGNEQGELQKPESSLTVPLIAADHVVGVMSTQSYVARAYDDDHVAFMRAAAGVVASALESLQRAAIRDPDIARRASELEVILANMTDAVLIADADGSICRLNHAAREILGLGRGPLVMGQPLLDAAGPDRWPFEAGVVPDVLRRMFERVRAGEQVRDVEVELTTGPLRVMSFSGAPLRASDGSFAGAVIAFREITSRREIERLKDEMLASAWHDLRTPLTAIKGETQLLVRRLIRSGDERPDLRRGLEVIDRQADRLHELVDTLLDASGIQLGRLVIERVPTDLTSIVASVVETVRATSAAHDFQVDAPERCSGSWDGRRLRQVVENLVSNAVKYSPAGTVVRIEVEQSDDGATVTVTDSGIGLDPAEADRIFERGYRGERARAMAGDGLGLYISKAIVSAHGGRMRCSSGGPGHGSSFAFTIPMAAPDA